MTETVTIDKFGRILIPKALRKHLHLEPHQKLELRPQGAGLTMFPAPTGEIVEKNGLYVWTGDVPLEESWDEMTDHLREERVNAILDIG